MIFWSMVLFSTRDLDYGPKYVDNTPSQTGSDLKNSSACKIMIIIMEAMPQLRNITSRAQRQVACNVQNRLIFTSKSPYISNNTRRQVQHHRDTGCGVTRRPLVSSIRQRNNHVRNRTRVPSMLSRNFGGERAWRAQPAVMNICTGNRTGVAENDPRHWVAAMAAAGVAAAAVIHQVSTLEPGPSRDR